MWESTRNWPAKHGADLRADLGDSFKRDIEEVFGEMVYFLAFAGDFAIWCQLKETPNVQNAVRSTFIAHVREFAQEHSCGPMPSGEWLGDSLVWIPNGTTVAGEPLANLDRRFELYRQSLSRRRDSSAGERAAHVLAALCGTMRLSFIVYATPLFLGPWDGLQHTLGSFKIKA
jgi:hypothetical protein